MIVADTGAVLALIDADDRHHAVLAELFERDSGAWVLPWAILPEVDYLLATHVGRGAQRAFLADLADGLFNVEWGRDADFARIVDIHSRYDGLALGLVDATVMVTAERLSARAIATLDLRDFAAVEIKGSPKLLPRDLT